MNARNFDKLMQSQIENLKGREKLLLHCCCAPCSTACLERLKEHFDITVLFYNPNIEDCEYARRKNELIRLLSETGWAEFADCDHDTENYYLAVKGYENEPEGGKRCEICFKLRLSYAANYAKTHGFGFLTTTLTVSPLKDAALLNGIGENLAAEYRITWLYSDFKKRDGYLKSIRLSQEHNLYRQNYCGCVFSEKNT